MFGEPSHGGELQPSLSAALHDSEHVDVVRNRDDLSSVDPNRPTTHNHDTS
jgi:hypothetical protein